MSDQPVEVYPGPTFWDDLRSELTRTEVATLEPRAEARIRYAAVEEAGGRWAPPLVLREAMDDWKFEAAGELMDTAESILDDRAAVIEVLAPVDGGLPAGLEASYEEAVDDLAAPEELMADVGDAATTLRATHERVEGATGLFWAAVVVSLLYPSACVVLLYRRFRRRAMAG